MTLRDLFQSVLAARHLEEAMEDEYKKAKKMAEEAETAFIQAATDAGESSIKFDGLGHAVVEPPKPYPQIKEGQRPAIMEWLKAQGHADAIKETIHPMTFMSIAREELEKKGSLPDGIEVFFRQRLSIRKL